VTDAALKAAAVAAARGRWERERKGGPPGGAREFPWADLPDDVRAARIERARLMLVDALPSLREELYSQPVVDAVVKSFDGATADRRIIYSRQSLAGREHAVRNALDRIVDVLGWDQ
jgi:hypothetical protein